MRGPVLRVRRRRVGRRFVSGLALAGGALTGGGLTGGALAGGLPPGAAFAPGECVRPAVAGATVGTAGAFTVTVTGESAACASPLLVRTAATKTAQPTTSSSIKRVGDHHLSSSLLSPLPRPIDKLPGIHGPRPCFPWLPLPVNRSQVKSRT